MGKFDYRGALNTVLRVDRIMDSNLDLHVASKKILSLLLSSLNMKGGSISFFNPKIEKLEFLANKGVISQLLSWKTFSQKKEFFSRSYLSVPIMFNKECVGVVTLRGNVNEDSKKYARIIEEVLNGRFKSESDSIGIKRIFEKYVGGKTLDKILKNYHKEYLEGERTTSTIMFADMNGFTSFTNKADSRVVVKLLNEFLSKMSEVALKNGGTVDKFIGDEIMIVFGAPIPQKNHASLAMKTAKEMMKSAGPIMKKYKVPNAGISVGIATGRVVSGAIGSDKMADYTVVGKKVNLAARLTSAAGQNKILVDETTKKSLPKFSFKKVSGMKIKEFEKSSFYELK
jgi:class 3 adenylate cyclase